MRCENFSLETRFSLFLACLVSTQFCFRLGSHASISFFASPPCEARRDFPCNIVHFYFQASESCSMLLLMADHVSVNKALKIRPAKSLWKNLKKFFRFSKSLRSLHQWRLYLRKLFHKMSFCFKMNFYCRFLRIQLDLMIFLAWKAFDLRGKPILKAEMLCIWCTNFNLIDIIIEMNYY